MSGLAAAEWVVLGLVVGCRCALGVVSQPGLIACVLCVPACLPACASHTHTRVRMHRTEPLAMSKSRGRTLRFLANVDPIDVVSGRASVEWSESCVE